MLQVLCLLPWLLISPSRLDTRDLTQLASAKGLGALLELSLVLSGGGTSGGSAGHLAVRGANSVQAQEVSGGGCHMGRRGIGSGDYNKIN